MTHGATRKPRKQCSFEGCTNNDQKGGVCITHGAKVKPRKQCSHEKGCNNQSRSGGVCYTHGARCSYEGCNNKVIKGGVCTTHGAKVVVKRCIIEGCTNVARRKGGVCCNRLCMAQGTVIVSAVNYVVCGVCDV